jgi:hypothetical protein
MVFIKERYTKENKGMCNCIVGYAGPYGEIA